MAKKRIVLPNDPDNPGRTAQRGKYYKSTNKFTQMGGITSSFGKNTGDEVVPVKRASVPKVVRAQLAKDMLKGRTVEFGTRSMLEGMRRFMGGGGFRQHGR
jgi:hypothetical protein